MFIASKAMPPVIAPSPMTAMQLFCCLPFWDLPTLMPSAAEIEVVECPAPKQSYSLSALFWKPLRPPCCRKVPIRLRLPVRILCG